MQMIERVARAILSKVPSGYGMTEAESIDYARAAIEAMREPTKFMASCGADAFLSKMPETIEDENERAARVWRLAIDAALQEVKETEG